MALIEKPADIITHIIQNELQNDINVNSSLKTAESIADVANDKMAFTVHDKQINSKKLIEGIASNSRIIPYFKDNELLFRSINSQATIESINQEIKSSDIISYSNKRTSPEKVYTKVIVKYNYDYALEEFKVTTEDNEYPDSIIDIINNAQNGQAFQDFENVNPDTYLQSLGLENEQEYIFEANYIRREGDNPNFDETARLFQQFLLLWNCNQHNILKLKLPLKYIKLSIGDYVGFDKTINGVKLFGEDYSLINTPVYRNGQQILPIWMVTSTNKTLTHIDVELIQMHNCEPFTQDFPPTALINGQPNIEIDAIAGTDSIILNGEGSFDPNPEDEIVSYSWEQVSGDPVNTSGGSSPILTIQNPDIIGAGDAPYIENHNFKLTVTSINTDEIQTESTPAYANITRTDYDQYTPPPIGGLQHIQSIETSTSHNPSQYGNPYSYWDSSNDSGITPQHNRYIHCVLGNVGSEYFPSTFPFNFQFYLPESSTKPWQWTEWETENNATLGFRLEFYRGSSNFHNNPNGVLIHSFSGGSGQWLTVEGWSSNLWEFNVSVDSYIGNVTPAIPQWESPSDIVLSFDILDYHWNTDIRNFYINGGANYIPMTNEILEISSRVTAFATYENGETVSAPNLGNCELHFRSYPETITDTIAIVSEDVEVVA